MSGRQACRTVDGPQTTPSAGVWEIPPCLCVCLFAWWVRGAPGRHVGSHSQATPGPVQGGAWRRLRGCGVLVACVPGAPGPRGGLGSPIWRPLGDCGSVGYGLQSLRGDGAAGLPGHSLTAMYWAQVAPQGSGGPQGVLSTSLLLGTPML